MNLDDSWPFCFGKAKKLLENRFTRQRYPKFFYQFTYIFKGRIFHMLFPSQYCDCGLKFSWKFRYTNKTSPGVFFKKVPLSSYPPVGHTVDQNYRGIQQFRIRQTKRHKYLETFCRWVFLFLFLFFLSAVDNLFSKVAP